MPSKKSHGIKPKDLIGIPWRVAFALQADGWYLRQDIIWHKPNPMPESVTDRCTKAHEYIFLLSKSKNYYFDSQSIQEESETKEGRPSGIIRNRVKGYNSKENAMRGKQSASESEKILNDDPLFRNKRSVWTVSSKPYAGAHFAVFPPDLIKPCILAGCPQGGVVLDPFGGSGTTGLVCDRLGRSATLIELNPDYAALAKSRISADLPMIVEVDSQ